MRHRFLFKTAAVVCSFCLAPPLSALTSGRKIQQKIGISALSAEAMPRTALPFSVYEPDTLQTCLKNNTSGELVTIQFFSSGLVDTVTSITSSLMCTVRSFKSSCTNQAYQDLQDLLSLSSGNVTGIPGWVEVACKSAPSQACVFQIPNSYMSCKKGSLIACTDKVAPADLSASIASAVADICGDTTDQTGQIVGSVVGGVVGAGLITAGIVLAVTRTPRVTAP